jgi:hypothetical protein
MRKWKSMVSGAFAAMLVGGAGPAWAGGWYLMYPPIGGTTAPVYGWAIAKGYDTAARCEAERGQVEAMAQRDAPPHGVTQVEWTAEFRDSIRVGRCIASDDPRLRR